MASKTIYAVIDGRTVEGGEIVQLFTSEQCANRVAGSRPGHSVKPMNLKDAIDQCGETQQLAPNSSMHCLLPDGHDGDHTYGQPAVMGRKA